MTKSNQEPDHAFAPFFLFFLPLSLFCLRAAHGQGCSLKPHKCALCTRCSLYCIRTQGHYQDGSHHRQSRLYSQSACSFLGIYYCATSQCYQFDWVTLDREADQHVSVGELKQVERPPGRVAYNVIVGFNWHLLMYNWYHRSCQVRLSWCTKIQGAVVRVFPLRRHPFVSAICLDATYPSLYPRLMESERY